MTYLVTGTLIGVFGLLIAYNGHFYIGFTVFATGLALGIKGNRQV